MGLPVMLPLHHQQSIASDFLNQLNPLDAQHLILSLICVCVCACTQMCMCVCVYVCVQWLPIIRTPARSQLAACCVQVWEQQLEECHSNELPYRCVHATCPVLHEYYVFETLWSIGLGMIRR